MSNYGEFASLLQLGVGMGIGLSLFRAPVAVRVARITRILDGEIQVLGGIKTDFGRQKRHDLMALKLRFVSTCADVDRRQFPFMIAAVVGAALNLLGLVKATLDAETVVEPAMSITLLMVSIGYFLLLIISLEVLARFSLGKIQNELEAIQTRRAPPIIQPAAIAPRT